MEAPSGALTGVPPASAVPGSAPAGEVQILHSAKMRDFFCDLGRILYPERPFDDPLPPLTNWHWTKPGLPGLFSGDKTLIPIRPSQLDYPVMGIYGGWLGKQLDAVAVQEPTNRGVDQVRVYVIGKRFAPYESLGIAPVPFAVKDYITFDNRDRLKRLFFQKWTANKSS